jgi:outer membrane protein assembly factor BamE
MRKQLLVALTLISLAGCTVFPGVYKMDVAQGNEVTQEMVDQLRPGMTQSQVRYVMGTPLLTDTFNQNRWDYIYQMVEEDERTEKRRVTLYFENNRLTRLEGDLRPGS